MFNYIGTILTIIMAVLIIAVGIAFIVSCFIIADVIRDLEEGNEKNDYTRKT